MHPNCVILQEHLQVRGSCTNRRFLLSEQGAQWLQGKQSRRDRERLLSYEARKGRQTVMQLLPETEQQVGSLWKLLMCVISAEHRTPLSLHPSKIT